MQRWVLELVQLGMLAALAVGLHAAIRRTGGGYAEEIFEANPKLGRTFLVLADIGFYLIFAAYTLFNVQFQHGALRVGAGQAQEVVYSVAGIALIIGVLHVVNIVALPIIARMLSTRGPGPRESSNGALSGRLGELLVTVTLDERTAARG